MCTPYFKIHLSVDRHLGEFYNLAVVKGVAISTVVHISLSYADLNPLGKYQSGTVLFLAFLKASVLVTPVYTPSSGL